MLRRARLFLAVTTPVASNALCLQRSALLADRSALIRHRQTIIDHRRQVWEKQQQQQQHGGEATAEHAGGSLVRQLTDELSRTDAMIEDFGRSLRQAAAASGDGQLLPQPTSPTLLRTDEPSATVPTPPTRDPPKTASYLVPRTVAGTSVPMKMPTAVVALANATSGLGERSLIVADTGSNRLVAWDSKATSCQLLSDQMALPLAMAVTTDQKHLVVAAKTATGGEVMVVETAAPSGESPRRLIEDALVPVPHNWHKPCAVLALPDGNVLVADNGSLDGDDRPQGRLVVVSPKTKAVVRVLPPSPAVHCPTGLALYPTTASDGSGPKVLVCNGSSGGKRDALVVIDCADGALLRASNESDGGMVGPPDGRFKSLTSAYSVATHNQVAYVADSSAGELVTVSLQTGMVLLRQPMPGIRRVSVLSGEPPALAVSVGNEVQIITL